jgi:hypothetical protein
MTTGPGVYTDAPRCPRCGSLHRADLPCWHGTYARTRTRATLTLRGRTCWLCGEPGATTADHRVPRSRGGDDELTNLMPAHRACNGRRGNTNPPGEGATLIIVTGPPAAGKTHHVHTHAAIGDVLVDLDALTAALGHPEAGDPHAAPDHVRQVAQRARSAAIQAAYRLPAGVTAWVIHTAPSAHQRAEYLAHGAVFVEVDPGAELTHAQAIAAGRPTDHLDAAARWYATRHGHPGQRAHDPPDVDHGTPPGPLPGISERFRHA